MSLICSNCGRGVSYGHAVSHAKNRVRRIFKPNLQKLKVMENGIPSRVKMCTRCIQRMKKDGHIGKYTAISYIKAEIKAEDEIKSAMAKIPKVEHIKESIKTKAEKKAESIKIEDIVGKK